MLNTQWGTLIENACAGAVAFIDFFPRRCGGGSGSCWVHVAEQGLQPPSREEQGAYPQLGF